MESNLDFAKARYYIVEFSINGKESTKSPFILWIYSGEKVLEVKGTKGKFAVPSNITSFQNMDIKLHVGKFDLSYTEITPKHFDNKWIVIVVSPPFESTELPIKDGKKPKLLYRARFLPANSEGVVQFVAEY